MKSWVVLLVLVIFGAQKRAFGGVYSDKSSTSDVGGAKDGLENAGDGMTPSDDVKDDSDGVPKDVDGMKDDDATDDDDDDVTDDDEDDVTDDDDDDDDDDTDDGKPKFFTEAWRSMYAVKQLKNQAKWLLAEMQPSDGSYQVRVYPVQWWATSHKPCQTQELATSSGYMALYFYANGFNYQRHYYPLTYPVLLEVDKRPKPTRTPVTKPMPKKKKQKQMGKKNKKFRKRGKKRWRKPKPKKVCPTRYTSYFYLPLDLKKFAAKSQDTTIKTLKCQEEVYYVREYASNYTSAYCNEQGRKLALDLLKNNVWTWENYWICAKYEPAIGQTEQRYEVWMKRRLHE